MFGEGVEFVTLTAGAVRGYASAERRIKPRLRGSFPSLVRGVDAGGAAFRIETALDDISAAGLHLRLRPQVRPGAPIFVVARLKRAPGPDAYAPRVALRCVVLRSELCDDGSFNVAAAILRHRFLDP